MVSSPSQWFHPREDGFSSLRIVSPSMLGRPIAASPARLTDCAILGALSALRMVYKQPPSIHRQQEMSLGSNDICQFDPLMFQLLIHDGDLNSLQPGIVGEWHPALCQKLLEWKAMDASSSIASFANLIITCFDFEVSNHSPPFHMPHLSDLHLCLARCT